MQGNFYLNGNKSMIRKYTSPLLGLLLLWPLSSFAGAELDQVNTEVEARAKYLDEQYGILMTSQERANHKVNLVAKRLAEKQVEQPEKTVQELVDEGAETYQITDTYEQRQLLIEIEAAIAGSGGGNKPPCCEN